MTVTETISSKPEKVEAITKLLNQDLPKKRPFNIDNVRARFACPYRLVSKSVEHFVELAQGDAAASIVRCPVLQSTCVKEPLSGPPPSRSSLKLSRREWRPLLHQELGLRCRRPVLTPVNVRQNACQVSATLSRIIEAVLSHVPA